MAKEFKYMDKNLKNFSCYLTQKDSSKKIKQIEVGSILLEDKAKNHLRLHQEKSQQEILGFGGAFTESSASIYHQMKQGQKEEIIEAYFGKTGNQYNMGRTHINSCDFSLENYAHCDTPGDLNLSTFSIERDKKMVIPFIKDALELSLEPIKILASPWSPPSWMKTNNQMNHGGKLIPKFRTVWANYYCKYIQFYENENIPIWGLTVQNEPEAKQTWDSCLYSAEEERDFVKYFLGPALYNHDLKDKRLIIWDHNRDVMFKRAQTILSDSNAYKYVWGTGFHWYNGDHFDEVKKVHDMFPNKNLIFTEGCQENGPHIGSWDLGERYATSIINDLNRWTRAWLDWNLILDEKGGPNHVGNYCSAPIIYDTSKNEVLYQSSFYYIGHFSRFIKRGHHVIESILSTNNLLSLSSIDPQGKINTIIMNKEEKDQTLKVKYNDSKINLVVPKRSIITLIKNQ